MVDIDLVTRVVLAGCALLGIFFAGRQLGYLGEGHAREGERQRLSEDREEERRKANVDQELHRRRANAETLWRQYELLCIEHPDLAAPEDTKLDFDNEEFDASRHKFTRYEYFVSLLLYAIEEIHEVYRDKQDWCITIDQEIRWHQNIYAVIIFSSGLRLTQRTSTN